MVSMAKELQRLIRRAGKLTDGQASVCDVEWAEGAIDSFRVEIRPNSGLYQGGIFKFRVNLPTNSDNSSTAVQYAIDTPIIISTTILQAASTKNNVSLTFLDKRNWNHTCGTEGVVIGLVYQLHNCRLTLYFDCDKQVQNLFKEQLFEERERRKIESQC